MKVTETQAFITILFADVRNFIIKFMKIPRFKKCCAYNKGNIIMYKSMIMKMYICNFVSDFLSAFCCCHEARNWVL